MDSAILHTVQAHAARTFQLLRELGPVALAIRLVPKVTRSRAEIGGLTFFMHRWGPEGEIRSAPGFTVRQLFASDKAAILFGTQARWEELQTRLLAGDLCFGALDDQGRAVHTRWVTLTRANVPELHMDFVPGPGAAYFYDGYTRPDARRHGIDGVVRAAIFKALSVRGRKRVYSYVRTDNPEGLRAAARHQEAVATVRYARFFGSRTMVFGLKPMAEATLVRFDDRTAAEATKRAAAWRGWFEGWLKEPLAKRSIGFHTLPEEAFKATAEHISATLQLDVSRDYVLDVGCDSALVTRHVATHCARIVGVDFIPGMLVDAQRSRTVEGANGAIPRFASADGRALPFPSGSFAKAYCTGVIHTLPSVEDGLTMVLELVRVLEPRGRAVVAGIPDLAKRAQARREAWARGGLRARAGIVAAMAIPPRTRRLARRLLPGLGRPPLRYLEYDLHELRRLLETRGLECAITDYPTDFWSRDFRLTRSNLVIKVPALGPRPQESVSAWPDGTRALASMRTRPEAP